MEQDDWLVGGYVLLRWNEKLTGAGFKFMFVAAGCLFVAVQIMFEYRYVPLLPPLSQR